MNIPAINGLAFQQKFRLKGCSFSRPVGDKIVTTTTIREYSNPEARRLYELAQKEKNPYEKEKLLSQMGHYELVEEDFITDKILPEIRELFSKKRH